MAHRRAPMDARDGIEGSGVPGDAIPAGWHDAIPAGRSTVDLHAHTIRSDGVLEPVELLRAASSAGIALLAIADHDDLSAYRELRSWMATMRAAGTVAGTVADTAAAAEGLSLARLLPGVEINCLAAGLAGPGATELHVLGYGLDPDDDAFEAVLAGQRNGRRVRFDTMLARLRELGMPVDDVAAELPLGQTAALGRPVIARLMRQKGYVTGVNDAFDRYLDRGRPAYLPREGVGPIAAIAAIVAAGGIPVLAHPPAAALRPSVLDELRRAGLRGLEAYHPAFSPAAADAIAARATALGMLTTGGTDFHGDIEPYAAAHAEARIPPGVELGLLAAIADVRQAVR